MDRHLLEALFESFTDTVADKVIERLQQTEALEAPPPVRHRPLVKARPRLAPEPLPPVTQPSTSAAEAVEEESEYLTTEEAAVLLKVSPKGLEGMRCKGRGPKFVKIGGRVRYRRSDLV